MATSSNYNMEAPPPPSSRHGLRPRAISSFSITSDKSGTSKRSEGKEKLRESHDEKRATKLSGTTKANPNAAMNEMQPIAQQLQPSTMGQLRATSYFDMLGNPITDPDLSNPTRRRTERPLETIKSFESAIDREYRKQREANRQSFLQQDSDDSGYGGNGYNHPQSRRASSYWGGGEYVGNGYYANNQNNGARRSQFDIPPSRNKYGQRQMSDPQLTRHNNGYSVYSTPGYGMTRDTINTGGSNGSTSDQWHNSTDPSSADNSSIERMKAEQAEYGYAPQREPISEDGHYTYGNAGYNPAYMGGPPPATPGAGYHSHPAVQGGAPPPLPKHGGPVQPPTRQRQVISLSGGGNAPVNGYTAPTSRPSIAETPKRKSWLKRTFSKNKG